MSGRIAVVGYAGVDHVMRVDRLPAADHTAVVTGRVSWPWPRQGGCAPYVARQLAAEGFDVEVLTWLGGDDYGQAFLAALRAEGIGVRGVDVAADAHTAHTFLFYAADDHSLCFYDPGQAAPNGPSDEQRTAVMGADWLCVTVGFPAPTAGLLDDVGPEAKVAWAVKADPDAFPPELVHRLLNRAVVVACNRAERAFLQTVTGVDDPFTLSPPGALVLETRGGQEVVVQRAGQTWVLPVSAVAVGDTTGAGDTFFAACLAHHIRHPDDPPGAAQTGIDAARRLLERRSAAQMSQGGQQ